MFIHQFAAAAGAAVNAHDAAAIAALWAEPADDLSPLTGHQRGLDSLRAREQALLAGFSDVQATITVFGQNGPTGAMLVSKWLPLSPSTTRGKRLPNSSSSTATTSRAPSRGEHPMR